MYVKLYRIAHSFSHARARPQVVLTGGKTRADIARAWAILKIVVDKFLARNTPGCAELTHSEIVQLQINNKKLKRM